MKTTRESEYELCRHIRTNGDRCQSPSLLNADFCYFHKRLHDQHARAVTPQNIEEKRPILNTNGELIGMSNPPYPALDLGPLEDRASVQMAISTVLNALAAGRMQHSRATALLYGLQLASTNCVRRNIEHGYSSNPVRNVEITPEGDIIAA